MPTPSEAITALPSPPVEGPPSSRASFASCPPAEEEDEHFASLAREDRRVDSPSPEGRQDGEDEDALEEDEVEEDGDERMTTITQAPTPEPELKHEARPSAQIESRRTEEDGHERMAPSSESEAHLAHSMATAAISPEAEQPLYLTFPPDRNRLPPTTTSSFLKPGARFKGTQQSDRQVYDVQVEIKDVNLAESFLCGYLRIQGLTDDHPTLTTFFEGEIIGSKHMFKTSHPSWGSSEKVDLQHWARFPAFQNMARAMQQGTPSPPSNSSKPPTLASVLSAATPVPAANPAATSLYPGPPHQHPHLFMRWKESFLVPDHRVRTITGASFEGFYYICFDQVAGSVSGIYFHAKSEKYQRLELEWVRSPGGGGGGGGSIEFR